ncbi:MAG: AAA family ATPase [Saprospiraceae bacterium]|nr:AAA family ATPase [Saprospiraceae bacterium]
MISRTLQIAQMKDILHLKRSSFVAVTGRRRVGKTYLIEEVYKKHICLSVTGIQSGDKQTQIINFEDKIIEKFKKVLSKPSKNWQELFILLKKALKTLPKNKKQVIFLDELPWMNTAKSNFIQLLAHLWNDYLSKEKHFILVICGSSTSWIHQKIINDKGGFHNRLTHSIHLDPFTLSETKQFLQSKKITLTDTAIAEIYMAIGGIPFYLEDIKRGESTRASIERMCFKTGGILKKEYENLYRALFDNAILHESVVAALALSKSGLTRDEIISNSKVRAGGPIQRTLDDLKISGFIVEENQFGKRKRGAIYRLIDEYSVFYHRFIKNQKQTKSDIWSLVSNTQSYKIWRGYAFETLCLKHIEEIKHALGIGKVYTETSTYKYQNQKEGIWIDFVIDRKDAAINLCECKFYEAPFEITKIYGGDLQKRKFIFREKTNTKKSVFTTLITNHPLKVNQYSLEVVDASIHVSELM